MCECVWEKERGVGAGVGRVEERERYSQICESESKKGKSSFHNL